MSAMPMDLPFAKTTAAFWWQVSCECSFAMINAIETTSVRVLSKEGKGVSLLAGLEKHQKK
jgi:hypothetical protein